MRQIRIIRPKRMEYGAHKLQLFVDGQKAGDLANGKEITLSVDESRHAITGHGGLLAGKGFSFEADIPSGGYSYTFQVDMLNAKSGYTPILRPTDGQRLKDDVKIRSLIGAGAVQTLLKDETRALLTPGEVIQIVMKETGWQLTASENGQARVLTEQGYGSTNVTGLLLGGIAGGLDRMNYDTPEHRQETLEHVFGNYLKYLPDFEVVGDTPCTLRFKG